MSDTTLLTPPTTLFTAEPQGNIGSRRNIKQGAITGVFFVSIAVSMTAWLWFLGWCAYKLFTFIF